MKTDEQFLKDRLDLFETEGWLDLIEELKNMDTERTYPEVDHLKSETALNMANARKIAVETEISRFAQ